MLQSLSALGRVSVDIGELASEGCLKGGPRLHAGFVNAERAKTFHQTGVHDDPEHCGHGDVGDGEPAGGEIFAVLEMLGQIAKAFLATSSTELRAP